MTNNRRPSCPLLFYHTFAATSITLRRCCSVSAAAALAAAAAAAAVLGCHPLPQEEERGVRVLIDLGAFFFIQPGVPNSGPGANSSEQRCMAFGTGSASSKSPDNVVTEVFRTNAGTVVMNGGAAGSGGKGNVNHARFGNGLTLLVDLVVKQPPGHRAPYYQTNDALNAAMHKDRPNLLARTTGQAPPPQTAGKALANAEARAQEVRDELAAGGDLGDEHCYFCCIKDNAYYRCINGRKWCGACYTSFSAGSQHGEAAENTRPGRDLCRGCPGCSCEPRRKKRKKKKQLTSRKGNKWRLS